MTRRDLFRRAAGALSLPVLDPVRALAAEVKRVRITDIESFQVRVPGGNADDPMKNFAYGVSRVHTDAGVTGTAFLPCPGDILRRWVKPTLVGQDLFAIDRHHQDSNRAKIERRLFKFAAYFSIRNNRDPDDE